jgi:dienelactone hydrolase
MRMSQASVIALVLAIFFSISSGLARAQDSSPDRLRAQAAGHADLKFSGDAKNLGSFSTLENAIFQPDGVDPFPAIVLVHSCGGINERSRYWTEEFLKRGYVVLVIDSFSSRGVKTNCGPKRRVSVARSVKDAFDALAHLQKLDFVDAKRIGLVGTSWGGAVGHLASSKLWADALSGSPRFGAIVSLYGDCRSPSSGANLLREDVDRPLLVLMGDADKETPPADCLPTLHILKERGAPVEWHIYPGATHVWDSYSTETTKDSGRRIFEFMERHVGK